MASVILTNWTVFYADDAGSNDTGYKQIRWTGGGAPETTTNTVNALYSALADLFSISSQNNANDTTSVVAVTPTVYNIGASDAGDLEPWFIDPISVQHLTGGSLQTTNWTRVQDSNAGIVKVPYTVSTTQFVNNDRGRTVTHNAGSTGTLLWFDTSTNEAWIRPTNSTSTHNWAMGGTNVITVTGGTGNVTQSSAPKTGERLWANIYTLGTIESNTLMYVYQNFTALTGFWSAGHIDRLILINDGFASGLIDYGYLTIYARQYSKLYDYYLADVSAGGRNPIPLATSADTNNTTGYKTVPWDGGNGSTILVGDVLSVSGTARAIVTAQTGGTAATGTINYYLIGTLTDFSDNESITATGGKTFLINGTPTTVGPTASPSSTVTIGAGGILRDLNNSYGSAPYSIEIDLQGTVSIGNLYQRLKYVTRRGQTSDIETQTSQSLIGQEYTAIGDLYLPYDTGSQDNPFTEGEIITASGSFTCVLTSKHDQGASEGFLIVRKVRGTTPVDNTVLTGVGSGHTAQVDTNAGADPVATISPSKTSPFGTFAGGVFFGARGVWLANVPGADATKYQLIDSENVTQLPPATVPITVSGDLASGDRVLVYRTNTTNSTVADKSYLSSHASANTSGSNTFTTTASIPVDTPASGVLRVVDNTTKTEQRYSYASYSGTVFSTIVKLFGTLDAGLDRTYITGDTAYVPYIDTTSSGSSVSASVVYTTDRTVATRVRLSGKIPFSISGTLNNTGYSSTAVLNTDPNA